MTRYIIRDNGHIDIGSSLKGHLGTVLRRHAEARSIRGDVLVGMIVERVLRDNLVRAILDDEK